MKRQHFLFSMVALALLLLNSSFCLVTSPSAPVSNGIISVLDHPLPFFGEVTIGNQVWMTENLNVDRFRNGDLIPEAKSPAEWAIAAQNGKAAWCYYNNNVANGNRYGKLYNWYAVNDPRGLAPRGWHVPTNSEWTTLTNYLGGAGAASSSLRSTNGWDNNKNGSNESHFLALPGGYCYARGGFGYIGQIGSWWSATETDSDNAWSRTLDQSNDGVLSDPTPKQSGVSVRCVKN